MRRFLRAVEVLDECCNNVCDGLLQTLVLMALVFGLMAWLLL